MVNVTNRLETYLKVKERQTRSRGLFSTREREEDSKHRTRENRYPRGKEKVILEDKNVAPSRG